MLSIYNLKPKFQSLLKPVMMRMNRMGITANGITWMSIILSLFIGVSFWFADEKRILFLALPIGLFLRMALNALDGMMARTFNQQSKQGEVLNEVGDIISDLFIFFPLLKMEPEHGYLVVLFIALSIINEFSGLLGKVISGVRRYEGPMGKSDRAFVMGAYGLLSYFSLITSQYSFWIFVAVNFLLLLSTFTRIKKSLAS